MMARWIMVLAFLALAAGFGLSPSARAQGALASEQQAEQAEPIVLELYSSQGCSSCPRANRILTELSREPGVLPLTFSVGYWDYLGWPDTFARPEFTSRQRGYLRRLGVRSAYTPQMVVHGMRHESGARPERVLTLLDQVRATLDGGPRAAPRVLLRPLQEVAGVAVSIDAPPLFPLRAEAAEVWAVAYQPGPVYVVIRAGENAGHRMVHYNVVRRIERIGGWTGADATMTVAQCAPACAILVQEPGPGAVIGVGWYEPQALADSRY